MTKKVFLVIILFLVTFAAGCGEISGISSSAARPQILRKAEINGRWQLYHLKIEVAPGQSVPVLLKLADGDKVDGYFYLEKGNNVNFQVAGSSIIYRTEPAGTSGSRVSSDRFSFTAMQGQGMSYTLTFTNPSTSDEETKVTAFLELIYPISGDIYIELENKK
ncbi:MAG: hypothetical protein PHR43_00685 [Dehalococcoidales bacterium]|nr:hypothetical protein [Dehalococcoidales bacterium]